MIKLTVPLCLLILGAFACNSGSRPAKTKMAITDTANFYPIADFFRKQIEYVDLRNFTLFRITVKDGKRDSSVLTKDEFIALAKVFLDKSISSPAIKALYRETVFQDLSTNSYTLNYSPLGHDAEVKNIDVLLDEDTRQVKRIFIKSSYARGDTAIDEQYNWKADKSFQVNRFLQTKNGFTSKELNYVNWNDTRE